MGLLDIVPGSDEEERIFSFLDLFQRDTPSATDIAIIRTCCQVPVQFMRQGKRGVATKDIREGFDRSDRFKGMEMPESIGIANEKEGERSSVDSRPR